MHAPQRVHRAKTVCSVPGCPHARPCPEHPRRQGSTPAWRRLRAQALRRDRHRCGCGAPATQVHHRKPRELGGRDELANLVSVCARCHAAAHGFPATLSTP
jgi:5-methylcytosine-specific restriction endonuclease McrA